MPLPELIRQAIQLKLETYCEQRVPQHVRNKVRLGFRFRGNTVTLYEERVDFIDPERWIEIVVAQFRFDLKSREWTLYWPDRNSKWHVYYDVDSTKEFDSLLKEVSEDPTGIFWG